MQALLLEKPKDFRFIDIPEPPAPAAGEAVVRVHAVGICGTDYGGYLGKMASSAIRAFPATNWEWRSWPWGRVWPT